MGRARALPFLLSKGMAKSATGGTRGGLRGGLGDVYYQLTSNPNGDPVQLVKAWNKSKENVNTPKQAIARMICATVMWMMHRVQVLIQNSFQDKKAGVTSINYFSQVNIKLLQKFAENHWDDAYLVRWPEKGIDEWPSAPVILSEGSLQLPKCLSVETRGSYYVRDFCFTFKTWPVRVIDVKKALGLKRGEYFILINYWGEYATNQEPFRYTKLSLNFAMNDYTVLTQSNFYNLFVTNGNTLCYRRMDSDKKRFRFYLDNWVETEYSTWEKTVAYHAVLIRKKIRNRWGINTAVLTPPDGVTYIPFVSRIASEIFYSWWPEYEGQSYDELMHM